MVPKGARAHEFWVEPLSHVVAAGDTVEANLKVGQDYSGSTFPYLPTRFEDFTVTNPTGIADIGGTIGDVPAVRLADLPDGLQIITYASTADVLKFDAWETFTHYVSYEGNDWAVAAHEAAGLPMTGFSEAYRRNAKALVQVGTPVADRDVDRAVGMPLELIALQSPYAMNAGQTTLPVQLLWHGVPLADQQINIFHRDDVTGLSHVTTDAEGRAMVPVDRQGRYLLNAVHMMLNGNGAEHAWSSHWASLTFETATPD